MKALVLAGGSGTRLRPLSHSLPKQLIPVANRPVLAHVLGNIRELGVSEVGVVVGTRGPDFRAALGDGSRFGVRLTYLAQAAPLGLAHTVRVARDFLGDDDFVMYLGDNMLPDGIAGIAEELTAGRRDRRPAALLVVQKVPDPRSFGVAELGPGGRVLRLVEKPERPRSDLALVGVYFFTAAIHEAVAAVRPSARGELEITDAVQRLVDAGADVRARQYHGYWKDTGSVTDLLDCNRHLLARMPTEVRGTVDGASVLTGPVVVEPGARVVRSRLEGPVIVGARTVVEDSHVGPHAALGRDCRVTGSGLANSIALDRASVTGVRDLCDSVLGRSATVEVTAGAAAGGRAGVSAGVSAGAAAGAGARRGPGRNADRWRLVIGDDSRVEVSA
ncbi:glucose-1-phosphate thymidylyltransferase [Streptomyces sp. B6B3]|uniref:glucose-1-phosphate thymidylyltransferase n=1 Tax=Streptomyces sp. B6B3 TaxID=3153570 RepID=UPI00325EFA11